MPQVGIIGVPLTARALCGAQAQELVGTQPRRVRAGEVAELVGGRLQQLTGVGMVADGDIERAQTLGQSVRTHRHRPGHRPSGTAAPPPAPTASPQAPDAAPSRAPRALSAEMTPCCPPRPPDGRPLPAPCLRAGSVRTCSAWAPCAAQQLAPGRGSVQATLRRVRLATAYREYHSIFS